MRILSLALCASLAGHGIAPVVGWSKHSHSTELGEFEGRVVHARTII